MVFLHEFETRIGFMNSRHEWALRANFADAAGWMPAGQSGGAPLQGASLLASLHPGVLATLVPSVTERRRFQRLYAVGEEGLQRIALGPSVPDEGSRNSYGDGGALHSGCFLGRSVPQARPLGVSAQ